MLPLVKVFIGSEKFCMHLTHLGAPCFSSAKPTLHVDMHYIESVHLTGGEMPYISAPFSVESNEIKGGYFFSFYSLCNGDREHY